MILLGLHLKLLPDKIGRFQNLRELVLIDNDLGEFPDSFWTIQSLQKVYFGFNNLTEISPEMGKLDSLLVSRII